LVKNINTKYILYFHNDPLSMNGSKSLDERIHILNKVDCLIFVSKWTRDRFFIDIDKKLLNKARVIYPSVNKKNKFIKKEKKILFVGKLNNAKGYDIFGESIVKILDEFPDWYAYSIGNEERLKPVINHIRHKELGYLPHNKVLSFIDKCSIVTVPSRWEEPFGRVALEASSRGCATITSTRGGLSETTDYSIKLKN
jgi:glycosyltransferase involved in cell wall biosynthesis